MNTDTSYYHRIVLVVFIFLSVGSDTFAKSPPPPPAETAAPKRTGIGALGKIEPRSRVIKVSHDAGPEGARIDKLLVTEGQTVQQGDKIAIFSDHARKQAKRDAAKSQIAVLQARLEAELVAEKFYAKDYQRYVKLVQSNVAAIEKKDETERNWQQAKANANALRAELESAKANYSLAEEELKQSMLLAPVSGTILKIRAWPGERVSDQGVVEIADLSHMDVVAEIYERDMPFVKIGQKAAITVPGFAAPFQGEVRQLGFQVLKNDLNDTDPLADRDNRIVEIRISLPDEDAEKLKHLIYMQVDVRIPL